MTCSKAFARTAVVALVATGLGTGAALAAQDPGSFSCPVAGTDVKTDQGHTFHWLGTDTSSPSICLAKLDNGDTMFWAFALIPSPDVAHAKQDADYLRTLYPLTPAKPLVINTPRSMNGTVVTFRGTGIVKQGSSMLAGMSRPTTEVTVKPQASTTGPTSAGAGGGYTASFSVDQATNALLAVDISVNGRGGQGLSPVRWHAVSITVPGAATR